MKDTKTKPEVAVKDKFFLTLDEAAALFGIGTDVLRKLTDDPECEYVLWNHSKRLIKKQKLFDYLNEEFSIPV